MNPIEFSYLKALCEVENGPRIGWNEPKGLWFPHESLEGGTDTIAYGHKLTKFEDKMGLYNDGISERFAVDLLITDYEKAKGIAENQWEMAHKTMFSELPLSYQYILVDIAYNVGSLINRFNRWGWPKLAQAMLKCEDQEVYNESIRWYTTPGGVKKPLTRRSIVIGRAVGLDFQP